MASLSSRLKQVRRWVAPRRVIRGLSALGRTALPKALRTGHGGPQGARSHAERVASLKDAPRISIVMPAYRTPPGVLRRAVQSVLDQALPAFEFIIVDDSGGKGSVRTIIEGFAATNPSIKLIVNAQNMGISNATNVGVGHATGDFIGLVDHDDEVTPDALLAFAEAMERAPETDVWYSDQVTVDDNGRILHHFLKPDWSPVYAMGVMYVGHLLVVRTALCRTTPFRSELDGVQDFDFLLRVSEKTSRIGHVPSIAYKWRAVRGSLARGGGEKKRIEILQRQAVNEHLARIGRTWRAESHPSLPHRVLLLPSRRTPEPRVSIVIPTRNQGDLLGRCLETLFTMTDYANYEVIVVDNRTTEPTAVAHMRKYPVKRIAYRDPKFNYSAANNLGIRAAEGDLLVLLNNDTEIIDADWLRKMSMYFEDEGVGAVGATLLYPDRSIQHAGVILGPRGTADHVMRGFGEGIDGYAGSLPASREVSAVTAACMMLPRKLFDQVGGLSTDFAKHYQDVDLCLKIRQRGLRIIQSSNARLIHHESLSRKNEGYDLGDRAILIDRWREWIEGGDPYYNSGFATGSTDYTIKPELLRI